MKHLKSENIIISIALILMLLISGCAKNKSESEDPETVPETEKEKVGEKNVTEEAGTQEDRVFVSEDGKIELELPDTSWSCTADEENMKTLGSDAGVINIIFAEGDGIAEQMVPSDEDAYRRMVNGGMADLEFEVVCFETSASGEEKSYKGAVHYTGANTQDKYTVHYGIYREDSGYSVTAVLFEEDSELLEQIQNSVYGMKAVW